MYKNYFYLVRCAYELNHSLKNKTIHDIFSQEKNVLFLNISDQENPHQHFVISADQNLSYILIKQNHNKAKKNLVNLYNELLPANINSVSIADDDRIIKIDTDNFRLYFVVRGNNTNIFLEDNNNNISPFTKSNLDITKIIQETNFKNDLNFSFSKLNNDIPLSDISKFYPQIIKGIKMELQLRIEKDNSVGLVEKLNKLVNEIFSEKMNVGYSEELNKVILSPFSFNLLTNNNEINTFNIFNDALQKYLQLYYSLGKKYQLRNATEKYLDNELSKLSNKLNKLKVRIELGSKEDQYNLFGNLLQVNRHSIQKGLNVTNIIDYNTGEEISIKLDNKLSASKNIDKYFDKSRDEKINYQKSIELFNFTNSKYEKLLAYKSKLEKIETTKELEKIHDEIMPSTNKIIKMDTGLKFKYWHYLIEDKYHVYIGRDSKSNDYLSIKFAKQNDYWFHARGLPGSHVVLRVDNVKEGVPKDIIKKTASLSAFYSKAKTAGSASVSYTFAKFVHKKKGMSPGKVLLSKEKTLLVKP
ncbi:MAG: DUF814 domain-containing protein, partial [Arcobacter sp.]|nr:DUF814 domain-containing protein [Arcobacter sp.]